MKRIGKPVVFIVAIFIALFTTLAFTGVHTTYGDKTTVFVKGANNIRFGIDIRGGVDATFTPEEGVEVTADQIEMATEVMKQRLIRKNIVDHEVYADTKNMRIVVRFPWKENDTDFDPQKTIEELGSVAQLTFRTSDGVDTTTGEVKNPSEPFLEGKDVDKAEALYGDPSGNGQNQYFISLKLNESGKKAFGDATTEQFANGGFISIYMDETPISTASVKAAITTGEAIISGSFTKEQAEALANNINDGALPFKLVSDTNSIITPTLGEGALNAMVIAGLIAFILISIYMIVIYRLPGVVAAIVLAGHVGGMIAAISGFLPGISSFTLTIPGIAGIILSIGMGVDANVITAERIKEEIRSGKSIDGAIDTGFKRGFTAIFDGNITVVIVAIILMGSFGAPSSFFGSIFNFLFFMFGPSAQGSIYSFGYTLLVGVILNFLFSVLAARLMIKSASRFKCFRDPRLYGGAKNNG